MYRFIILTELKMVYCCTDLTADHAIDSDSEDDTGAQAPTLTRHISNILKRYPEGGQILKVGAKLNPIHRESHVFIV